ncbi:hypothetical protein KIH87_16975 [Paraneptunicella aestuarii]|uniref:AsmA-like C-terminal region-containing protein n=1 Tax=Paraneptunicella aestuarii TaxID=2831148 RepID=UPI001E5189D9|nr:AsmA-like C-terminal region-containing protein [Paraneptunicella aestuarii]UAA38358.1 hypothetical protein KIH87_16975 [Paraneptunicella aestuarii]
MSKSSVVKIILVLPILFILAVLLLWDPNWFKQDIEAQLKTVPHVGVKFGNIHHSLMSPGELSVQDIKLDGELVQGNIKALQVITQVNPLLSKEVIVDDITLNSPQLTFDMDKINALAKANEGKEKPQPETKTQIALPVTQARIQNIHITNASIKDVSSQQLIDISGLNITISNVQLVSNSQILTPENMPDVKLALSSDSNNVMGQVLGKLTMALSGNIHKINLQQLSLATESSKLNLTGQFLDVMTNPQASLKIADSQLSLADFSHFFKDLPIQPVGQLSLAGSLDNLMATADTQTLLKSLNGNIDLGLDNAKLEGIDINQVVKAIKESRETDLKDIGGFLISGPIGILATQLFDLGSGSLAMEGETKIPQLLFKSQIDKGVLNMQDTAFATDKYRIALDGGIDIAAQKFKDFTFSILDSKGCADIKQTLNGDINSPKSAVANSLLETVISPIKGLLGGVSKKLSDCKPVYEGEVKHPKK